jgi:hypothetical protein
MDPLGFGLENFDAIGAYRTKDGTTPIDSSGTLPDGRTFKGPIELKAIVKSDSEAFAECLTEKMMTYALGRGVEKYDRAAVKKIREERDGESISLFSLCYGHNNQCTVPATSGSNRPMILNQKTLPDAPF